MQYDLNLAANGSQRVEASGSFFKYASGAGKIRVTLDTGRSIELLPGQGVWNVKFSGLTVQDRYGLTNIGVLLAGEFDFRDDTITGTIGTYDNTASLSLAGNCFMGSHEHGGGTAQYNYGALINPVGSGVYLIITALNLWKTRNSGGGVTGTANAESVLAWIGPIVTGLTINNAYCRSKKANGTVSKAGRASNNTGGTQPSSFFVANGMTASEAIPLLAIPVQNLNQRTPVDLTEPLIVPAGYALYWSANETFSAAAAEFEFREVAG